MTDNPRPTFQMSIDTRQLYERLKQASVGETVTYQELSEIVGRDVRGRAYSNLLSARRRCMRQDAIVFGTVQKVGLQRLDDGGVVGTAEGAMSRIRRQARRAGITLSCVRDFDALPIEAQTKHNAAMSLLAVVSRITQNSAMKQLEKHVGETKKELPLTKTLEFFAAR